LTFEMFKGEVPKHERDSGKQRQAAPSVDIARPVCPVTLG
jgi:hypothetical protein